MNIVNICMGAPFTEHYSYQDNLLPEYQQKLGHSVSILTSTRARDSHGKIVQVPTEDSILDNGVRLIRLPQPNKLQKILGFYPQIPHYLEILKPDMIFIHGLASMIPGQSIRYQKKHPNVVIKADNHQDNINTKINSALVRFQMFFYKRLWKSWINYISKVYGTTSWRVFFTENYYGIPSQKLDTLYLGVDIDRLSSNPSEVRRSIRLSLQIPQDSFVFITGGKLSRQRKILEIMQAFSLLSFPNLHLVIFGTIDHETQDDFEKLLSEDKRIKYIGYIQSEEVHRYFFSSDFGLFPGLHSVLWEEAIGCSLPCLFKKYGANDHTNVCGNCIQTEDISLEELLQIMKRLLEDKNFYRRLKDNAEKAAVSFSYRSIAMHSLE